MGHNQENIFIKKIFEDDQLFESLMRRINTDDRFSGHTGVRITELGDGWAAGELEVAAHTLNPSGAVHGGCIVTLCDTVAGAAVFTTGYRSVTLNCTTNFLREARGGKLTCRAEVVKPGRTISVCDVSVKDMEDRLVATGTFTFFAKESAEETFRRKGVGPDNN